MISFSYSALTDDINGRGRFNPRINVQRSQRSGPYYQIWLTADMGVCLSLSDADCRKLLDVLGSRPPMPKSDAQIDVEAEPLDPMEHQRNAAVLRRVGGEDAL